MEEKKRVWNIPNHGFGDLCSPSTPNGLFQIIGYVSSVRQGRIPLKETAERKPGLRNIPNHRVGFPLLFQGALLALRTDIPNHDEDEWKDVNSSQR